MRRFTQVMLNEAALRWFNDLAEQGILITDDQLTIREWNHWLESRSGRSAADIIGRSLLDEFPELVARGLDRYYRDALNGQVRVLSHRLHHHLIAMPAQGEQSSFERMQQSARIAPLIEDDRVI